MFIEQVFFDWLSLSLWSIWLVIIVIHLIGYHCDSFDWLSLLSIWLVIIVIHLIGYHCDPFDWSSL